MQNTWKDIVKDFPTTPFLFVGSGLTRRYFDLPNWEELLKHFAAIISDDSFIFQRYMQENDKDYEKIGSAISKDFDSKWFRDASIRTNEEDVYAAVKAGVSPFKAELAHFIKTNSIKNEAYAEEIALLQKLTENNISGFITTNYDTFIEDIAAGYKTYNSQEELIFSPIQEMAEIFKIHGSVTDPASIVITAEDYQEFNDKCAYLAAKLLTIFMEYPIIFIGYSITDNDIQKILSAIIACLSKKNVDKLQNRFIFVKRNAAITDDIKIVTYSKEINGQDIFMTQLETNNFKLIYEPLTEKQAAMPVKLLRFFKDQFYNFTLTNQPSKHIFVNAFDPNVPLDQLCCSIGQNSKFSRHGLNGIEAEQWYKEILFDNTIPYSYDDILSDRFEKIFGQCNALPIFKFISKSINNHDDIIAKNGVHYFDDLFSKSIREHRNNGNILDRSVKGIIANNTINGKLEKKALNHLALLTEEEINIYDLGEFLRNYINENPECLSDKITDKELNNIKTNIKRLIRVYDWLKYHKK